LSGFAQQLNDHCQAPIASGGGSIAGFEDLEVWQQAHQLTIDVYKLARQFPVAKSSRAKPQGRRGGNLRCEWFKECFSQRRSVSAGENALDYLPEADYNNLLDQYNVMGKMLNGLINKIKKEVQSSS